MIYALLGMVGFGVADFLVSKLSNETGHIKGMLWNTIFMLLLLVIVNIYPLNIRLIDFSLIGIAILSATFHTAGGLSFYKGAQVGKLSILSPLASSYSIVIVFYSLLFLKEDVTFLQILAIFFVIIGTIILSTDLKEFRKLKLLISDKSVPYGIASLLMWGVGFIFIGRLSQLIGWKLANLYITSLSVFFLLIISSFSEKSLLPKNTRSYFWALLLGVFSLFGYMGYSIGIEKYVASVVGPIVASAPIVTIILAAIFLKEKITKQQITGASILITGMIMLAL